MSEDIGPRIPKADDEDYEKVQGGRPSKTTVNL